jgi:hypothetical protein
MVRRAVCSLLLLLGCETSSPGEEVDSAVGAQAEQDGARGCARLDASCDAGTTDARSSSNDARSADASPAAGPDAQALDAQALDAQSPDAQIGDAQTLDATSLDSAAPGDARTTEAATADAQRPEAGVPQPAEWRGTLVSLLAVDESSFITQPHQVELMSAETGLRLEPAVITSTGPDGKFRLQVPDSRPYWVHVLGQGSVTDSDATYDSLTLWVPESGDKLVRIGTIGTVATSETTANFVSKDDHVPVQGTVYRVDTTGRRIGMVGCAKIFLDDLPSPALVADQRYVDGVLPTTLAKQARTERSGRWYFGNIAPGLHTFKVSLDEGQTFLAQTTVYVPLARQDASSPFKATLVHLGIDVPGPDPTPANCPEP